MARSDLHVHSKLSNRPSEWVLRQIAAPESYTEPLALYRACRERGMSFVTISDHDTIDGGLEIAHLPGTFLSEEVTVCFPEDGCQIHCLVFGISEAQHRAIQEVRGNVYDFRGYLLDQGILHSVAHPLYRVNEQLTVAHVEKLLVLFDRFEARNGIHDAGAGRLVEAIFGGLTPETLADLAERHRLAPRGAAPWIKSFTGGSDDHGGFFIATTWTETPEAATVEGFLAHVAAGRCRPGGEPGSSLRLTQSLYTIAGQYYRRRFGSLLAGLGRRRDPFARLLCSLAQGAPAAAPRRRFFVRRPRTAPRAPEGTLAAAHRASQEALAGMARDLVRRVRRGRPGDGLAALAHLGPLVLSIAPHVISLRAQHKDRDLLDSAARRFGVEWEGSERRGRKAWFTDAPTAGDGVARARREGEELVAITCAAAPTATGAAGLPAASFRPLAELAVPGFKQRLAVPPVLEILDHCERERYSEIVISTPGPLGLVGLAAARLLGIPVTGVYSADLPLAVGSLTEEVFFEDMAWRYVRWFFGQMDRLYTSSGHEADLPLQSAA